MTDKNDGKYLFADYDEHRKAPIPQLISKDHHASWDRTHYDFGHYGRLSEEGNHDYKIRDYMTWKKIRKFRKYLI